MATLLGACVLVLVVQSAPQATVEGSVHDAATGRLLPGAEVVLTDLDRGSIAGPDGRYTLVDVPAGPQHLTVRHLGYVSRTLHLLVPRSGRLEFNVGLEVSPIPLEGMLVEPRRPVRGLDAGDTTAFPDRGITHAALQHHPTLAQPDALWALAGGEVFTDPEAPTGVHVRGGGSDHTGYVLDGVPVLSPYHAAGLFSAWNPDALSTVRLEGASPSPALPDALSGVITATTRDPGDRLRMQSALSNTEARVTVDGPVAGGAGYLLAWRSGVSGPIARKAEASYLSGETGDLVAKVQLPLGDGGLRLLLYDSENELQSAGAVRDESAPGEIVPRNAFEWASRSMGVSWTWSPPRAGEAAGVDGVSRPRLVLRLDAWQAAADAGSAWNAAGEASGLAARRRDRGLRAVVERRSRESSSELGMRFRAMSTRYRADPGASQPTWEADGSRQILTAFALHSRPLSATVDARAGAAASITGGGLRVAPRAQLRWRPGAGLAWTAAYSRTHQFAQSLRNPESVAGHVFPPDLFVGAGAGGVPVPVSDQGVLAAEWASLPGLRVGAQGFVRRIEDVLLVAPVETGPFATGTAVVGSARARGVSLEVAAGAARWGLVGSWGWQRVQLAAEDSEYTPRHGATHTADVGLIVFPSATSSLRASVRAASGRTATAIAGPFEWEACNLLDQGCEFAGSPESMGSPGGTELPLYLRVDVGGTKHWHLTLHGRDILVGVFATAANVIGRSNVLGYVVDPDTGRREAVTMLPRAPLVLGVDLGF